MVKRQKKKNRTQRLQVRITPDDLRLFKRAAKADGQWSMGQWSRTVLTKAARKVMGKGK